MCRGENLDAIVFESDSVKNRSIYISNENKRVVEMSAAVEEQDYQRCGFLLNEGLIIPY